MKMNQNRTRTLLCSHLCLHTLRQDEAELLTWCLILELCLCPCCRMSLQLSASKDMVRLLAYPLWTRNEAFLAYLGTFSTTFCT